jgi:hypothetical protein
MNGSAEEAKVVVKIQLGVPRRQDLRRTGGILVFVSPITFLSYINYTVDTDMCDPRAAVPPIIILHGAIYTSNRHPTYSMPIDRDPTPTTRPNAQPDQADSSKTPRPLIYISI